MEFSVHTALASSHDVETADLLIAHGANIDDLIPVLFGQDAKLDYRQRALIKFILAANAKIAANDFSNDEIRKHFPDSSTPLLLVTMFGRLDVIRWLLDSGVNVNDSNAMGDTPMHMAVVAVTREPKQKVRILQLLLEHGALINSADKKGLTPLHFAAGTYNKESVDFLLRNGANPLVRTAEGLTATQMAQRSQYGTGLFGLATTVDETQKSATIDELRAAATARPVLH